MATDIVGSKQPQFASQQLKESNKGYGQNAYSGASSDLPGQHTTSGFLPQSTYTGGPGDWQTRVVKADGYPAHPGMSPRRSPERIPDHNVRRPSNMK